jgi:AraC-like DNA-binding protein
VSTATYQAEYRKDRYINDYRREDATATRRRLQALIRLGWTLTEISAATGLDRFHLSSITRGDIGDRVNRSTVVRVETFYDNNSYNRPVGPTADRMRTHGLRHNYLPPAAWDDITDITEVPDGG